MWMKLKQKREVSRNERNCFRQNISSLLSDILTGENNASKFNNFETSTSPLTKSIRISIFSSTKSSFSMFGAQGDLKISYDSIGTDLNHISNKYPQKDQVEHLFKKAPGNFAWDVNPRACGPCRLQARKRFMLFICRQYFDSAVLKFYIGKSKWLKTLKTAINDLF
jgi:hypothetical protein